MTLLRDVDGAVQAVAPAREVPSVASVRWHQRITPDGPAACRRYAEVFGWTCLRASPDTDATHCLFAMDADARAVGWFSDMTALPGAHPHWLFYFDVADIDAAVATVRAGGGRVMGVFTAYQGWRLAPCEDPQGAAFGLIQKA